jgi:hypothetical protein
LWTCGRTYLASFQSVSGGLPRPEEGLGGFDAYGIFTIEGTSRVLLECPVYGNAAYVVDADQGDWKNITKRGMIESDLAEQIPHRGEDWPAKIRQALGIE